MALWLINLYWGTRINYVLLPLQAMFQYLIFHMFRCSTKIWEEQDTFRIKHLYLDVFSYKIMNVSYKATDNEL